MSDQLFTSFSSSSKQDWQQKVVTDLKGKAIEDYFIDFDPRLEAIDFLAHRDDVPTSPTAIQSKTNNNWRIGETIIVDDPVLANKQALLALAQGANSIRFELESDVDLEKLCSDVKHEYIHTTFSGKGVSKEMPIHFKNYLTKQNQNPDLTSCSFFYDTFDIDLFRAVGSSFELGYGCCVRSNKESVVDEISELLSQLNFIFDELINHDFPREHIGQRFTIEFVTKDNFYLNITSLRAIHLVVQQLKEAWDIPDSLIDIRSIVMPSTKESANKDSEKISGTSKAMAAVIGGISELVIVPKIGEEDSYKFEHRIVRNIQLVMQLESYMDRVVDPSAGSYFIENLTEKIAETAWNDFRKNCSVK